MKHSTEEKQKQKARRFVRERIIKPSLILMAVALVAALSLSHVKRITQYNIDRQERMKQEKALAIVLPGYIIGNEQTVTVQGTPFTWWNAEKKEADKVIKAYAFLTSMPGYSGPVKSMVGVDETGIIQGISVLEQTETPGLGTRCTEIASTYTIWDYFFHKERIPETVSAPWFQEQFKGLNANEPVNILKLGDWTSDKKDNLLQRKAITAITGATITSRAVTRGVEKGFAMLKEALASQAPVNAPVNPQGTATGGVR